VFEAVKVTSTITKKSVTVVTSVNVPGPGKITQVATTARPKKKAQTARLGERKKKKPKMVTLCKVTKVFTAAGNFPLTCKMNKKGRAALRKKSMKLTITTTFTPANGKPTVTIKIIKLKRKR
jgi:hypothetical protein